VTALPKAVPSAVAPSTQNSVPILTEAQLGPYQPMSGSAINPVVPRTEEMGADEISPQPGFGGRGTTGEPFSAGSEGAPSVPGMNGALFTPGPIDTHYVSEAEARNPYSKVNNPPTRGMFTRIQPFANHIAQTPQDVDPNGFRISPAQQRTSVMRNQLPNHGIGYAPETATPRALPQRVRFNRIQPTTGTDPYGSGVLNNDTLGAGQTAGGIGGNNYTPDPGPPDTTSTAGANQPVTDMPTWG
jgi:hypothetical protein